MNQIGKLKKVGGPWALKSIYVGCGNYTRISDKIVSHEDISPPVAKTAMPNDFTKTPKGFNCHVYSDGFIRGRYRQIACSTSPKTLRVS